MTDSESDMGEIVAMARAVLDGRETPLWGCREIARRWGAMDVAHGAAFDTLWDVACQTADISDAIARGGPVPPSLRRQAREVEAYLARRKAAILGACREIELKYSAANWRLPEFLNRQFAHGGAAPLGLDEHIFAAGRATHALLYAPLFLPALVEIEGSVLLAWSMPEKTRASFVALRRKGEQPLAALEASFNFVEIGWLFDEGGRDLGANDQALLAEIMADAWRRQLRWSFPDRSFTVEVVPASEEMARTVGLHFFEVRNAGR